MNKQRAQPPISSSAGEPLLLMGLVGRPQGIKGELSLTWHGDYIPVTGDIVFLKQGDAPLRPFEVQTSRFQKKLILSFVGITDRNAASSLTGAEAYMDRHALPALEADTCYLADLIGSSVFLADGTLVGQLNHYEFPAGQPVWSIKTAAGREILFPAMPCFIKSLAPEKKEAIIDPPPGLLEIYNA